MCDVGGQEGRLAVPQEDPGWAPGLEGLLQNLRAALHHRAATCEELVTLLVAALRGYGVLVRSARYSRRSRSGCGPLHTCATGYRFSAPAPFVVPALVLLPLNELLLRFVCRPSPLALHMQVRPVRDVC